MSESVLRLGNASALEPGERLIAGLQDIAANKLLAAQLKEHASRTEAEAQQLLLNPDGELIYQSPHEVPERLQQVFTVTGLDAVITKLRAAKQESKHASLVRKFSRTQIPLIGRIVQVSALGNYCDAIQVSRWSGKYGEYVFHESVNSITGTFMGLYPADHDGFKVYRKRRRFEPADRCDIQAIKPNTTIPLVKVKFLES